MTSISVRPAVERDADTLAQIMRDAFQASYPSFMPAPYVESWQQMDTAATTISRGLAHTGVAELGMSIRGFATLEDDFLAELWVSPTAQGQGIGKTLVDWAGTRLINTGRQTMNLYCYGHNASAMAFYERLGFRVVETFDSRQVQGGPVPVCILSRSNLPAG